jgi:hypothetical protein
MKTKSFIVLTTILFLAALTVHAQGKFYTKTGKVSFFSSTVAENIQAMNKSAVCLLNPATGSLEFSLLIKGFEFKKALMQEDFNSADYMNSSRFPKSTFKGTITNNSTVQYNKDGSYPVTVKGQLTMHGVTKEIEVPGTINIKDGKIQVGSSFNILLADYGIKIPAVQRSSISKSIKITVDCALGPLAG